MVFWLENRWWGTCAVENWIEYCNPYSQTIYNPIYLPNSNDLLYAIENRSSKKFYLMKNGKKILESPYITNLTSLSDWKSFMYITSDSDQYNFNNKQKKYFVVKGDYKSDEYNWISRLTVSSDWKSFAFLARDENWNNIIKDWKKLQWHTNVIDFLYSPDWKSFVFRWFVKWEWAFLVKDWLKIENVSASPRDKDVYIFSEKWNHFAYVWVNWWKYFVVNNGVKWEEYDSVSNLTFSQNWNSLSFIASKKNNSFTKWQTNYFLVKDWVEFHDNNGFGVNSIKYSPDWKSFSFVVKKIYYTEDEYKKEKPNFVNKLKKNSNYSIYINSNYSIYIIWWIFIFLIFSWFLLFKRK